MAANSQFIVSNKFPARQTSLFDGMLGYV